MHVPRKPTGRADSNGLPFPSCVNRRRRLLRLLGCLVLAGSVSASEVFVEAEDFAPSRGWTTLTNEKYASGLAVLSGAGGWGSGVATSTVSIKDAGTYRIWVRRSNAPRRRGTFRVTALAGGQTLGSALFDTEDKGGKSRLPMVWESFEAELPEGEVSLLLGKHENRNCAGYDRKVDCLLLTMDTKQVPNHLHYGAPTYLRVTPGAGYERPIYIHIFADHFHKPWYAHYSLGRTGLIARVAPARTADLLGPGERTPWCNLTPTIYQDSGARLVFSVRYGYTKPAERLRATLEFATAPDEQAIVRTLTLDCQPGTAVIYVPPNLLTEENRARLKTDREIAEETGRMIDAHPWPTHGRPPEKFPFFAANHLGDHMDAAVQARERKTFEAFGFMPERLRRIGGAWHMRDNSYCKPDIEKMRARLTASAASFAEAGGRVEDVVYGMLTDEPVGQALEFAAADPAYAEHFRAWLKTLGKTPAELQVPDWASVKIVPNAQREEFPELHYYSQRFRTRALGDFMAVQRQLAEEIYGGPISTLVNFSDGAIYSGNFYAQGVDYFELLDAAGQNAIWGEDWANGASTYQCATFNVELMRGAARERGQKIGHFLIAYAGRRPWDIKLKATSELARGVKILKTFYYGPIWASHEGGPYWRSSSVQGRPEVWSACAGIGREIGAVEDLLLPAMPKPAKVALLYSSASDIWTLGGNLAYGFDRMHTWLALAHAQVPVDVVSETQVERGLLEDYTVCYLSGPNLTRAAAAALKAWVARGGTLWLSAGAASSDEYNRPMDALDDLLPAVRAAARTLQPFAGSGRTLRKLSPVGTFAWPDGTGRVLSVQQALTPREGAHVLAAFADGSPAIVRGPVGRGRVYCAGLLPALDYIKTALDARTALEDLAKTNTAALPPDAEEMLARSYNPWDYPAALRDLILTPIREAGVASPIRCSEPLVDAVYMPHGKGILVPLANYANKPLARLTLSVEVSGTVDRIESARRGGLPFRQQDRQVELTLPLDENDFVKILYR